MYIQPRAHSFASPYALAQLLCQWLVLNVIAEELCVGNQTNPLHTCKDTTDDSRQQDTVLAYVSRGDNQIWCEDYRSAAVKVSTCTPPPPKSQVECVGRRGQQV
jgi:hypothetical protein